MRIIFIRHGHPDYKNDCLTELGHKQAEAAAERLKGEKIDKFYSSSCGRAYETALHIAEGGEWKLKNSTSCVKSAGDLSAESMKTDMTRGHSVPKW